MKTTLIQLGIGLLPVLLGFVPGWYALPVPFFLISLLFLALWVWLCFRFCAPTRPVFLQILRVCLPGFMVLGLVLLQELVPSLSLPGILISTSQFFFLSGIALAGRILTPFLQTITAWPYYVLYYLLLSVLCILSMVFKQKVA